MRNIVNLYFDAETRGDGDAVTDLCADNVVIRNAAQPPHHGRRGAREFVQSFRDRTTRRQFTVLATAEEHDVVYAWWRASLTFRGGVSFGPVVASRPFDVDLEGVCRFKLNKAGQIVELDVAHETTSVLLKAIEAAA